MGLKSPQGASLSFSTVSNGNLYTSKLYNEFSTAASAFGSSTPSVNPEDLITVGRSKALETGFANGKFNSSVCDICNAGTQHNCGYNCNCNYKGYEREMSESSLGIIISNWFIVFILLLVIGLFIFSV